MNASKLLWCSLGFLLLGGPLAALAQDSKAPFREFVLVDVSVVSSSAIAKWKEEKFSGVAIVLNEGASKAEQRAAGKSVSEAQLDLFWWIEVARNPKMASANPRWMAGLGSHADWQKRFSNAPEPGFNEVAKAYPWVPIVYAEAYDAHLNRIEQLLKDLPQAKGVFVNDLQAGPGSCGCGNLQCRWAVDYHVRSTAKKVQGGNVAGRFVIELQKRTQQTLIPVWTTECEHADMPTEKNGGKASTGFCGSVGCATGACPTEFSAQLSELLSTHNGALGVLATHESFQRSKEEIGGGPEWVIDAIDYIHKTLAAERGRVIANDRIWAVVNGGNAESEQRVREAAKRSGAAVAIVARVSLDQTYEPRIIRAE
ncbi:MAG TPA: hypothetical protein VF773_05710 [Verrucomicrobiae bacterium]